MRWRRKESSHQYPWYWSSLPWIFRHKHLTARLGDPHIHGHTWPSLIQIMDCLLLHYQFWLNIHWIVVNKLQWYFNQIELFPFIEIFCKYRPFCSGFVCLFECLFHTGCNKTFVPAQPLLPMFLLLIYLKISYERCKPFFPDHNGVYFFYKACKYNGQFLPHQYDQCSYYRCDFGDEPWYDESGNIKFVAVPMKCAHGTSTNRYEFEPHNPCGETSYDCGHKGNDIMCYGMENFDRPCEMGIHWSPVIGFLCGESTSEPGGLSS